jgi:hypothetical protein
MLWTTHIRISTEVLRRLGINLSSEVYSKFKEGIVAPDKWEDFPHHYGKSEEIEENLQKSRAYFLRDDLKNSFFYLGVALHYIQDSYTSVISYRSPNNQTWHQNYEQYIENSDFVYNLENTIQYFFQNNSSQLNRYFALARILSGRVEGKNATLRAATLMGQSQSSETGKAKVDLNMALKASLVVTESILSSKTSPGLDTYLRSVLLRHEDFLRSAEIEASDRIVRLVKERDELVSKKVQPTGFLSKVENWITGIRISLKNRSAISASRKYFSKLHLTNVATLYEEAARKVVASYEGWYNFQIPQINMNIVERDLLSVQEVAGLLNVPENSTKEWLNKANVPSNSVGNWSLVRRPELNKALSQFLLNGFKECQS